MKRRTVLQVMLASPAMAMLGCGDDTPDTGLCDLPDGRQPGDAVVVRKGASQMTPDEIERFQRAWELLVESGVLAQLAVGHTDLDGQRHHGAQILGDYTAVITTPTHAQRFLCWHRAYVLDLEQAMRAALVADYLERGLDCTIADTVFVPYFDGSSYPDWLSEWMPNGTPTGIISIHLDDRITPGNGHESNGLAVGDEYEVVMRSFEGTCPTCPTAPPSARLIEEALAHESFSTFSTALENLPGLIDDTPDPALADYVRTVAEDIVDKEGQNAMVYGSFQAIADIIETGAWASPDPTDRFVVVTAQTALDRGRGFDEYGIQNFTDEQYEGVLNAVNAYIQRSPHAVLHFFSAGESQDPAQNGLYGSSAYFQDAGADPHFYMLHCELDRYFATWLASNADMPPLEGEDRLFKTWGGAREWTLDELMDPDAVPFAYDSLWTPS